MKILYVLVALAALTFISWFMFGRGTPTASHSQPQAATSTQSAANGTTYVIDPSQSSVAWAGTKPLIPGYVDSGTIGIKEGTLSVDGVTGQGSITMDMNSVVVGKTAKPSMESALTGKLKSAEFFDVATYPMAAFTITGVKTRADTTTSSQYDVTGTLTMKGKTNDVTFPAKIFLQDGKLHAEASLTIDRTKWGITFGSKDFFSDLANNVISNDVTLDLSVVANPQ